MDGLVGQPSDRCPDKDDPDTLPPFLLTHTTDDPCWCEFIGCSVATPDKSRFCADHAAAVEGEPDPPVNGLGNRTRTREQNGLPEVVWTCDNCSYPSLLVPRDGCPQCDGGKLTKREVAARRATPPRKWEVKNCAVDVCDNEVASGADFCELHYVEKLQLQCEWPLGRPGGGERCINTGRPYGPSRRQSDGYVYTICEDHIAMLRDGTEESSPPAPTEVVGESQPEALPY